MEVKSPFDTYEFIGVITPGAVTALLLVVESRELRRLLGDNGMSIGDFGLFVVIAFVLGHLVQSVGNLIEPIVWPVSGLPTNRLRHKKQKLISDQQQRMLIDRVAAMEGAETPLENYDRTAWGAVMYRAYSRVRNAGRSARIDVANRSYGLFRGLSAAFAIAVVWSGLIEREDPMLFVLFVLMLLASVSRMRRSGSQYARALALEFIDLSAGNSVPKPHN